jgi:hypothetical protein
VAAARIGADLAELALRLGQAKLALDRAEEARMRLRGHKRQDELAARVEALVVDALRVAESPKAAADRFALAMASAEPALAQRPAALVPLLVVGADTDLLGADPGDAVGLLERALPLTSERAPEGMSATSWARWGARCRFELARALHERPASAGRALELVHQARAALESAPETDPLRVEVDAWLAARAPD